MASRRKHTETTEYLAMLRRLIRGAAPRVADADELELAELLALQAELDQVITRAVHGQREMHGRSWADIARATGTTRQAAAMRWGRKVVA